MVAKHHFIANEYLRAFDLKEIFAKYVVYYQNLHYSSEALSSKDRLELTAKLEEAMNEMNVLVLKMKDSKSEVNDSKMSVAKPPVQLRKVNEFRMAN